MVRTITLSLLLTGGTLALLYRHHAAALVDPCQSVAQYCDEQRSLGTTFQCGVDLLSQMVNQHTRIDCYRTWLTLHSIESPTLEGWLNAAEDKPTSP